MTDIHIPPEALEAGARELLRECNLQSVIVCRDAARAAFTAMVEAWPGMWVLHQTDEDYIPPRHDLILPLTEKTDDKA